MSRWMDKEKLFEEYGIRISTQAKKRSKGLLPYVKWGGLVMYDRNKIDAMFEAHHIDVCL